MSTDPAGQPIARRARGLARIASILDAAAAEFASRGYDRTTTNSIAKRAGISPGSLYQYFSDKGAIADALAARFADSMALKHTGVFAVENPTGPPLHELVQLVVDPIIDFNVENPGFLALFARTDLPERLSDPIEPAEAALAARLHDVLQQRNAAFDANELSVIVESLILMFRGLMTGISALTPASRDQRAYETRAAITAYLQHRGLR